MNKITREVQCGNICKTAFRMVVYHRSIMESDLRVPADTFFPSKNSKKRRENKKRYGERNSRRSYFSPRAFNSRSVLWNFGGAESERARERAIARETKDSIDERSTRYPARLSWMRRDIAVSRGILRFRDNRLLRRSFPSLSLALSIISNTNANTNTG